MYIIYALFFEDVKRIYVGMTSKFDQRIKDHKRGKIRSTKNRGNFSVKIIERCETRKEAREREKYWKSGSGKEQIKKYHSGVEQSGSSRGS